MRTGNQSSGVGGRFAMAGFGMCFNFSIITLLVTSAWIFFGRNLSFGTLSLAMFFPTVFALIFKALSGEIVGFLRQTFSVSSTEGGHFSIVGACLVSVAITSLTIALCAILDLLLGWGHLAKHNDKDPRSPQVKALMSRRRIWGFLRASGEEVGWRCFLLPCLMETHSPSQALAISGLVWGLFHVAIMILLTHRLQADRPWTTVLVQCVSVFLSAYPHGWIAIKSGYSLWPSAVMHFTWNVINPWVLGSIYTQEPGVIVGQQWLINGEGLAGCMVMIPIAMLIVCDITG